MTKMQVVSAFVFTASLIGAGFAQASMRFGNIPRKPDGSVQTFSKQSDALAYCASHGWHAPSAHEIAEYAVSMGAAGIRETSYPNVPVSSTAVRGEAEQNAADGFDEFDKALSDRTVVVDFYYNHSGYKGTAEVKKYNLWTSSADAEWSDTPIYLDGSTGFLTEDTLLATVLCVLGN